MTGLTSPNNILTFLLYIPHGRGAARVKGGVADRGACASSRTWGHDNMCECLCRRVNFRCWRVAALQKSPCLPYPETPPIPSPINDPHNATPTTTSLTWPSTSEYY